MVHSRVVAPRRPLSTLLCLSALLLAIPLLWAAPFAKRIAFRQPDGTQIHLWGQGDEFYAVFETLDGYTVVFDQGQKAYCYATTSAAGGQLVSTGVQAHRATGPSLGLPAHLRANLEVVAQQVSARYTAWDATVRVSQRWAALKAAAQAAAEKDSFSPPGSPTVGLKVGLTMLIDFVDDPGTVPQSEIVKFCNGDKYNGFGNNGSVKEYYAYCSNGKLTYTNAVTIYLRAPMPKAIYNDVSQDAGQQARKLITDTLAVMKTLTNYQTDIVPLFDALTVDNQNEVVAFNVFYAGDNGGVWSMGLWPHSWGLASPVELSSGGKKVQNYQISNIGNELEIGTFCHENGHMLCGYPDLYDYTGNSSGAGDWCLMASGSWGGSSQNPGNNPAQICAYLKRASGWATTVNLNNSSSTLATVSASNGTNFNVFYRFPKPGASTEYYLAECRYKTNHDASLPGSGVAIWHIDELGDNSSVNLNPNSSHNNYEATLVQADNFWELEKGTNNGNASDLYFQGNSSKGYGNKLTDSSAPKAQWWSGAKSGLVFRDFSAADLTMYFVVGTNQPVPMIISQPTDQTVFTGAVATFSVGAVGFPPFAYQWLKDGTVLSGGTASAYSISNSQPADAGGYSVIVTNSYGAVTSAVAMLTVIPTVPLDFALNNATFRWSTDAGQPWYGHTNVSHDSQASARSYFIADGQQTSLRTATNGPGTLTFWWKVSSEANADILSFSASNSIASTLLQISGEVNWALQTVFLPTGAVSLQWTYTKDAANTVGADAGYVDQVSYTPGATLPYITRQPAGANILAAVPFTLSVSAGGTPPLTYQWRLNGADVAGATTSELAIPSPGTANAGSYSVLIQSPYGQVTSAEAYVGIVPLVVGGDNSFGQIAVSPVATNATAIAAGSWHSLALRSDGSVLAWGEDYDGQCNIPANLTGFRALAGGGYHTLALKSDGTVGCWGANYNGQATPPPGLSGVRAVAAGTWHSLALRNNGTVVAWGDDSLGQTDIPPGLSNVVAIAAGGSHSLALRGDGTVVAWGDNIDALGSFVGQATVPWSLGQVKAIAAGEFHSLAVRNDGTVFAWGDNSAGQCQVPAGLSNVVAVAGGNGHSVALLADGTVSAWGNNWNGQCTLPQGLSNVTAVAAGSAHTLLLLGAPAAPLQLVRPAWTSGTFTVSVATAAGKNYTLEYTTAVPATSWTSAATTPGTGAMLQLTDPAAQGPMRFYRVRQW